MNTRLGRTSIITAAFLLLIGVTLSLGHFHDDSFGSSSGSSRQDTNCSICLFHGALKSLAKPVKVVFNVALIFVKENPFPTSFHSYLISRLDLPYFSRAPPLE